jgi:uncharacterized protein Yka (UPF0111/DUF47 family)
VSEPAADIDAVAVTLIKLTDLVLDVAALVSQHHEELAERRSDVLTLGTTMKALAAGADEQMDTMAGEIRELNDRMDTVHRAALRALNARFGTGGTT